MNRRLRVLFLGLLILAASLCWWAVPGEDIGLAPGSVGQSAHAHDPDIEAADLQPQQGAVEKRARVTIAASSEALAMRSGLVIDVDGRPISGVRVERRMERKVLKSFETDSEGVFRFAEVSPADRFHVASDGYMTLKAGGAAEDIVRVIAALTRSVTGMVAAKDSGLPIAAAKVTLDSGTEWVRRLELASGWSGFLREEVQTDEVGRFEFEGVPDMSGGSIEIEKVGYRHFMPKPVGLGPQHLQLTMTPSESVRTLRGIVLDPRESPVEGARISLIKESVDDRSFVSKNIVTSEASGDFEITEKSSHATLIVVAKGLGVHRSEVTDPSEYLIIRLPGNAARMEGLVVDSQGQPVAGALIHIEGRSVLGNEESSITAARMGFYNQVFIEDVLNDWQGYLRSDSSGRFSFLSGGPESYMVRVIDKKTLATKRGRVVADRLNRFVLDCGEAVAIRGEVVDSEGLPVPGIHVVAAVALPSHAEQTEDVITDDQGEFSLSLSPTTESVFLMLWGGGISRKRVKLDPGTQHAVVTVARRCEVRLHWGSFAEWTQVSAHLADGQVVPITYAVGNATVDGDAIQVRGKVSAILTIPRNVAFWKMGGSKGKTQDFKFLPGPAGSITDVHF